MALLLKNLSKFINTITITCQPVTKFDDNYILQAYSFVFWTNRLGDKLMIFSTSLYYNILRAWCCTEMLLNKIITIYQHRYQRMSARYHIRHLSHYIELFPFGMKQNIYETQSYCLIFSYHCWNSKYPVHRLIVGSI